MSPWLIVTLGAPVLMRAAGGLGPLNGPEVAATVSIGLALATSLGWLVWLRLRPRPRSRRPSTS